MTSQDERRYKDEIEMCFERLDPLIAQRQSMPVEPGSDFALDEQRVPEPSIVDTAWMLLFVALDHMEAFRKQSGRWPKGQQVWPVHASWTLLRAALEAGSQLVWMISPNEQDVRLQRLLRFIWDDWDEYEQALTHMHVPNKRAIMAEVASQRAALDATAKAWTGTAYNGITTPINIIECIRESAKLSVVVRRVCPRSG